MVIGHKSAARQPSPNFPTIDPLQERAHFFYFPNGCVAQLVEQAAFNR